MYTNNFNKKLAEADNYRIWVTNLQKMTNHQHHINHMRNINRIQGELTKITGNVINIVCSPHLVKFCKLNIQCK